MLCRRHLPAHTQARPGAGCGRASKHLIRIGSGDEHAFRKTRRPGRTRIACIAAAHKPRSQGASIGVRPESETSREDSAGYRQIAVPLRMLAMRVPRAASFGRGPRRRPGRRVGGHRRRAGGSHRLAASAQTRCVSGEAMVTMPGACLFAERVPRSLAAPQASRYTCPGLDLYTFRRGVSPAILRRHSLEPGAVTPWAAARNRRTCLRPRGHRLTRPQLRSVHGAPS